MAPFPCVLAVFVALMSSACTKGALGHQCNRDSDCAGEMFCGEKLDGGVGQCTAHCSVDQDCPGWNVISPRVWCVGDTANDGGVCKPAPPN